jgi:hypothetical protein
MVDGEKRLGFLTKTEKAKSEKRHDDKVKPRGFSLDLEYGQWMNTNFRLALRSSSTLQSL